MSLYFGSRRELIRQVLVTWRAEILRFHIEEHYGSFDSIAALQLWASDSAAAMADQTSVRGCAYGALVGEIAVNADDALRADIASGYDTWRTIFQSGLSTMKARGELRDGADPRHLAAALIIAHQGSAALSQLVGSSAPLRATLATAVAYVGSFVADQSRSASLRTRLKTACHRGGTTPAQVLPSLRVPDRSDATV
jgi:TetR/AcrR family transcriptional repressor of nem operon